MLTIKSKREYTMLNCNLEFIGVVLRNASVALLSIKNVIEKVDHAELRAELRSEYEKYDNFIEELKAYMTEKGYEIKDVSKMKKMIMWSAIKMNVAVDDSRTHVAQIMVKGTVMGITELTKILNDKGCVSDEKAIEYASRLLKLEEQFEENLKTFL